MDDRAHGNKDWRIGKTVAQCNRYMLLNEIHCDVTFIVGEEKRRIPAHKYILISRSEVFEAMLVGLLHEHSNEIQIPDVSPSAFWKLLEFMYFDNTKIEEEETYELLYVARKYLVMDLVHRCLQRLKTKMSVDNVCIILSYADDEGTVNLCLTYIFRYPHEVLMSEGFRQLRPENIKQIISSNKLSVEEENVFDAIISWSEQECMRQEIEVLPENQGRVLGDILRLVRYGTMNRDYVRQVCKRYLPTELYVEIIENIALQSESEINILQSEDATLDKIAGAIIWQNQGSWERVQCLPCIQEGNADEEYSIINQDQIFPDIAVKREMANFETKCVNPGCTWKGTVKQYKQHFKECKFQANPCTQCGSLILNNHMKNDCLMRGVKCKHCNIEIIHQDYEAHQNECPKWPIKCDSCNKKKIPREKMQHHVEKECGNQKIQCPVAGCDKVDRHKFTQHVESKPGLHIVHNMEQVTQLSKKVTEILTHLGNADGGVIAELKRKVDEQGQTLGTVMTMSGGTGGLNAGDASAMMTKVQALEIKTGTYEGIVTTQHGEIERCISAIENIDRQRQQEREQVRQLEAKLHVEEVVIVEHALKISNLETTVYDGNLMWRITQWSKRRREAVSGQCTSIYSTAFYTSRSGYKMSVRFYPNGDGMGKGTHVSIFIVIMRGNYDALLSWPFNHRVFFRMIDQGPNGSHLIDSFRPDPSSTSFKRPTSEMNIASGCPLFMPLSKLEDPAVAYVKDDVMYVNVCLDICENRRNTGTVPGGSGPRSDSLKHID